MSISAERVLAERVLDAIYDKWTVVQTPGDHEEVDPDEVLRTIENALVGRT